MNSGIYTNPRIDRPHNNGDSGLGHVRLDPIKTLWVSSMMLFGTIGSAVTFSIGALAVFIVFTAISLCFGHSLGMHRRFIHRSYQCPKWLEYLFVHLGVLVGLAGPFGMLKTHDLRDWAQRQAQCHDYFSHGKAWYHDAYWQIFCSISLEKPPVFEIEAKIETDPVYRWMEKTWMLQQLPWIFLFYVAGGWGWICWGVCLRVTISITGHWLIGYLAHNTGHRDWHIQGAAVQGHNIPWTALLTMGENWHNNHHAFPNSAKFGIEDGQWDPGWWILLLLQRIGLVHKLRTPEQLETRSELVRI